MKSDFLNKFFNVGGNVGRIKKVFEAIFAPSLLAIDVGTSCIKIIELKKIKGEVTLSKIGLWDLLNEEEGGSPDEYLLKLLHREKIRGKRTVVSLLSDPSIQIRYVELPLIEGEDLKKAVEEKPEKYLSFPVEQDERVEIMVLGKAKEGRKEVSAIVVVVKKEVVESHLNMLKAAGLSPLQINVVPFALTRLVVGMSNLSTEESVAWVDIGDKSTYIVILDNQGLRFVRKIDFSSSQITDAIGVKLKLKLKQAEELKRKYGIPLIKKGGEEEQVGEVVELVMERLVRLLTFTFEYYEEQRVGQKIDKMYLSGGGARIINIKRFLEERLGMLVEIVKPFHGLQWDKRFSPLEWEDSEPSFACCVGLIYSRRA